jgi:hypothetical protein
VTPALFSVLPELLAAAVSLFGFAPVVGPLPAWLFDVAPFVGPLPASAFGCARAGTEKLKAIIGRSKLRPNGDITTSLEMHFSASETRFDVGKFPVLVGSFCEGAQSI